MMVLIERNDSFFSHNMKSKSKFYFLKANFRKDYVIHTHTHIYIYIYIYIYIRILEIS